MNYLDPERQDLPSASGFSRIVKCAGSFNIEKKIPSKTSKEAESGTRIHKALTELIKTGKANIERLSEEEKKTFKDCYAQYAIVLKHWKKESEFLIECEERFWLHDGDKLLMSGEIDVLVLELKRALIVDFKSGFGECDLSDRNWQLRVEAVLAAKNYKGLKEITVCIIQPKVQSTPLLCEYDKDDIEEAHKLILYHLEQVNNPEAKRIPGSQCHLCKARGICPEARLAVEKVYDPSGWVPKVPEDKARRLDLFKLARKVMEEEEGIYIKQLLADPEAIPGYRVMVGRKQLMPRESEESYVKEQKALLKNKMIEEGCYEERFVFFENPSIKRITYKNKETYGQIQ